MTAPEEYTRQQAADPATPQQVLADIAALRPDLRPVVALNPSAYPGLLDWLGTLGEPGVDTALAQRRDREAAVAGGLTAPDGPATPRDAQDGPAPWAAPEATAVGTTPAAMPVPAGGPFTAPGGVGPAGHAGGGFAGAGGPGLPHGGFGGGQAGRPGVGQPGFPPPGATGGSGSRKTLWIVLGVLGALLVAGVVVVLVVVNLARGVAQDLQEGGFELDTLSGETYGDNAELDALWDACADGDMVACDDLYRTSGLGTEYERFGDTCGGRTDGGAYCAGTDPGSGTDTGSGTAPGADAGTTGTAYGDDPALDALWDACAAEDMQACDDLYFGSPSGSEYEDYGDTCGGRTDGGSLCASDGADAAETYGDDPELDVLWDACAAGDLAACDDLYFSSGLGTEYEEFGQTCGRTQDGSGLCAP